MDVLRTIGAVFWVVLCVAAMAASIWAWVCIWRKAGYWGAFGLLLCIPVLNVVSVIYLGFADWPMLQNLRRARLHCGLATDEEGRRLLREAGRWERKGSWELALRQYANVARHFASRPVGTRAKMSMEALETKMRLLK